MEKEQREDRCQAFISHVIKRMENDRAMGARLRRADNPATEYQSWEYLTPWVDLTHTRERKAFVTVAAALARAKPKGDGTLGIGKAIAYAYEGGMDNTQAKARLRRLLACASSEEACDILRPLLQLISSRGKAVSYTQLLRELLYFSEKTSEKTRERWAQDFFTSAAFESKNSENPEEEKP
jgi:CRISPR system Cascade subunit CasB